MHLKKQESIIQLLMDVHLAVLRVIHADPISLEKDKKNKEAAINVQPLVFLKHKRKDQCF